MKLKDNKPQGCRIMSALTALDTSQHTTPLSLNQVSNNQFRTTALEIEKVEKNETPNVAALDKETPKVDLSNYYSNVQEPSFNAYVEKRAAQAQNAEPEASTKTAFSEQTLSNAVATAITHGMNPQDAVNIQKATVAYKTQMQNLQTSTFELDVA